MGAYLIDHPPRISQFSSRTNWRPSRPTGLIVLHTAESVMDTVGPDTGAEAVAEFIRNRTSYGSYHDLVDSDSVITLVPYELGAYQDGTGSNGMALSISFACATTDWRRMSPEKRQSFLRQGARAFVQQQAWLKAHGYPTTPLRLLTKAQSDAGLSGFIYHGTRDPGRRTDPGVNPPDVFPWNEWVDQCRVALGGAIMANLDKEDLQNIAAAVWNYNLGATKGGTEENPVDIPAESAKNRLNAVRRGVIGVRDWVDDLHDGEAPVGA